MNSDTSRTRSAALASRLIRALYPHGSVRRVLRGPLRGMRFVVQPGMGLSYALGLDVFSFPFLAARIRPGDVIYDIGANCGQMALFFSKATGPAGKVVSFEPVPRNFELLKRNLDLNGCANVQAENVALGSTSGIVPFSFDPERHTMGGLKGHLAKGEDWQQTIEVRCEKLDEFVERSGLIPSLMKIDVEGAGREVLAGAANTLARHKPSIFFEMHATIETCPELLAMRELQTQGYRILDLAGRPQEPVKPLWTKPLWCEPIHDRA